MRKLYLLTSILVIAFSVLPFGIDAANFYAQSGVTPRLWTNPDGTVWFDAPTGGNAYAAGVFPGSGDDVFTNGINVILNAPSTCRNLFVESSTANGLIVAAPLTIEGTLLGWSENIMGFGFAYPNTPTAAVLGGGAPITFTATATGTAHFLLSGDEVIFYWNQIAPIRNPNFNFGTGNTGSISQIGTLGADFLVSPEDIRFMLTVTLSSGTLQTDNISMTGMQIFTGSLSIGEDAILNLEVPVNADGTNSSMVNTLTVSGNLNATNATSYLNAGVVNINNGAGFTTSFNGADQTEGWWHTNNSPGTIVLNAGSSVVFNANADQILPALSYGNLTLTATNGTRNKTVDGSGNFIVNGKFLVDNSSVVFNSDAGASSNLDFRGDIENFGGWGTFVNDFLRLNGSSLQTISGGDPINIQNIDVIINNAAGVNVTNNLDLDQNLTITNGTLTIDGADLSIAGDFVNNGGFSQTGGGTTFDGSGATPQEVRGSATTSFLDVTATNGDLEFESDVAIAGILTLGDNVDLDADGSDGFGSLTLLSTATNTARVAPVPASSDIGGNVTIQRYLSAPGVGEIFRYISSQISDGTASQWTSTSGVSGNPYWYNETIAGATHLGWQQTGGALATGRGFALKANSGSPITLELTGELNVGDVSQPLTYTNGVGDDDVGWNLVGNPYASTIDLDAISFGTDIPWVALSDNTSGSTQYYYYNTNTGMGTGVISGGLIASGQSFWALASAAGQSVDFTENSKTTNNGTFRRDSEVLQDVLTINLSQGDLTDIALIGVRDGATKEYDQLFDVSKQTNGIFNVASLTEEGEYTAINVFGQLENGQIIPLDLYNINPGTYTFSITETMDPSLTFVLVDHYLDEEIPIEPSQDGEFVYNFEVTTDQLTFGSERFSIQVGESVITGIEQDLENIVLYPNPVRAGEALNLRVANLFENVSSVDISIIDHKGAMLSQQSLSPGTNGMVEIEMDAYNSGVYILRVVGNNITHHYKIVKN